MNVFPRPPASAVTRLLAEGGLPFSDLTTAHLEHFFGCGSASALDGIVGLELYDSVALLRSLAVRSECRGRGCGAALVAQAEIHAHSLGARDIYLLTTTAERFFERLGYARVPREAAPPAIQQTQEFSTSCPASSALMVKRLPAHLTAERDARKSGARPSP
jgi:amino-acid N-acetyltransferase